MIPTPDRSKVYVVIVLIGVLFGVMALLWTRWYLIGALPLLFVGLLGLAIEVGRRD